jgi:Rad3-related DNA helicase
VQLRNGLAPSSTLASGDFTVEMETGTGKTYVYLRTVFELNKRYGFTKFVIVVPSVAIKEGVYKSLQITEEHFKSMYAGVPVGLLPVRLQQAGAGAQLRHQLEHPDHGGDGWCHQREGRQQPVQGQREDRGREADRPDQGHAPDRDRG